MNDALLCISFSSSLDYTFLYDEMFGVCSVSQVGQMSNSQPGIIVADNEKPVLGLKLSSRIPQLDGPIPDPYDDALSTPNIYNYQGVVNEEYNVVNTPAPPELQAPTPAMVYQNDVLDDDEDEPLNENDDDDDLDDVDQGEELNTHHLVLAQFDKQSVPCIWLRSH